MNADPQSNGPITGINVTPLVDVVLVLLIVLMVTASAIAAESIPLDLPEASSGESVESQLFISIDADGTRYLNGTLTNDAALATTAQERVAEQGKKARARIAADGQAAHRHLVTVMDLLREQGIFEFAIDVDPRALAPTDKKEAPSQ